MINLLYYYKHKSKIINFMYYERSISNIYIYKDDDGRLNMIGREYSNRALIDRA